MQHVFVAGYDEHGIRFRRGFPCQRSDHIVGFIAFELQNWDAISLQRAPDIWDLLHEVARHLGPIRLVASVLRFFEGLGLDIELADRRNRFRLLVANRRRAYIENRGQILG